MLRFGGCAGKDGWEGLGKRWKDGLRREVGKVFKLYAPRSLHVHGLVACPGVLEAALSSGTGVCVRSGRGEEDGGQQKSVLCRTCAQKMYIYQVGRYSTTLSE